jgi:hypothetical protein
VILEALYMARIYQGIYEIFNKPEDFQGEALKNKIFVPKADPNSKAAIGKRENFVKSIYSRLGLNSTNQEDVARLKKVLAGRGEDFTELYQILFDEELLVVAKVTNEIDIKSQFDALNAHYSYFGDQDFESYKKMYEIALHVANNVEHNNNANEVYERAYKLMFLFGTDIEKALKDMDNFVKYYSSSLTNPLNDICTYEMPISFEGFDIDGWRRLLLIPDIGITVLEHLSFAEEAQMNNDGKAPVSKSALVSLVSKIKYEREAEDPKFSALCKRYKVPEREFERSLDFMQNGEISIINPIVDTIPDVMVDLGEINPGYKNQYLVKLPKGDPRALILGNITSCCQHIGGTGEQCVMDGVNGRNQAFYVLVKTKKPNATKEDINWDTFDRDGNTVLGQGYVWRGVSNNMVFDSWENTRNVSDPQIVKGLPKLAEKMAEIDSSISRVTIGQGKTPKALTTNVAAPDVMKQGIQYGDSKTQYELYVSNELKLARDEIALRLGDSDNKKLNKVISIEQAKELALIDYNELKYIFDNDFVIPTFDANDIRYLVELHSKNKDHILLSAELLKAYRTGKVKISDLKDLDEDKIDLLMSDDLIDAYETGQITASDLKDLDEDKIYILTSLEAVELYNTGNVTVADLIADTVREININILKAFSRHIANDDKEVEIGEEFPIEKIDTLTSYQAIKVYKIGKATVNDLKDLDDAKLKLIMSDSCIEAYKTGKVTVNDLKDFDVEKIKALTSRFAKLAYKTGKISAADLKDLDITTIKTLVAKPAREAYKDGRVTGSDIKDLEIEKIKSFLESGQKFDEWSKENLPKKTLVERLGLSKREEKSHVESVLQSRDGYTGQSVS